MQIAIVPPQRISIAEVAALSWVAERCLGQLVRDGGSAHLPPNSEHLVGSSEHLERDENGCLLVPGPPSSLIDSLTPLEGGLLENLRERALTLAFPTLPTHPKQAYKAS